VLYAFTELCLPEEFIEEETQMETSKHQQAPPAPTHPLNEQVSHAEFRAAF